MTSHPVLDDTLRSFQFARPGYDGDAGQGFFPEAEVLAWASSKNKAQETSNAVEERRSLYRQLIDPYEIRVLELKPGIGDDRLHGSLHHCFVEFATYVPGETSSSRKVDATKFALAVNQCEPVWYTALSYTWGSKVFDRVIECDNFSKAITESLDIALRQFRKPGHSIMLWIDQICINQDDLEEKKGQIPLMSRIYKHALNTIGWLGVPTPLTGRVLRLLEQIIEALQYTMSDLRSDDFIGGNFLGADSIVWKELCDFISRPWFKRLWVIQEIVLSRDLWILCGSHITTFDIVSVACTCLWDSGASRWLNQIYAADAIGDSYEWISEISIEKSGHEIEFNNPIFRLLRSTRHTLCFDPKDKVYGIFGICEPSDVNLVKIDYSDKYPASRLYHDIALLELSEYSSSWAGGLLCSVDHTNLSSVLPSWVPDWSYPRQTVTLGGRTTSWAIYNTAGGNKSTFSISDEKDSELNILGVFLDTISRLTCPFPNPNITNQNPFEENRDLRTCIELCEDLNEYPGSSTVFDAFWHTLVADKDEVGIRRSPDSFAEIFSLLLDESSGKSPTLPGQTYTTRQKRPEGRGKLTLAHLDSRTPGRTFQEVRIALRNAMRNRRLRITSQGFLGLFPSQTQYGDTIYILKGCGVPFVVRVHDGRRVRLIGECYVHGIMRGEVMEREGFSWESITII
ncbi:heterokaryon incompatibility protein-domain-containing protein [Daldinia eschscholtzii]|nr:heterokaryon incompatibility protein-domain-containing protein [Daldinia eschscholtzii]